MAKFRIISNIFFALVLLGFTAHGVAFPQSTLTVQQPETTTIQISIVRLSGTPTSILVDTRPAPTLSVILVTSQITITTKTGVSTIMSTTIATAASLPQTDNPSATPLSTASSNESASSPSTALAQTPSSTGQPMSQPTSQPMSQPTSSPANLTAVVPQNEGMSTGTKVGVGIGGALAGIIFIALVVWALRSGYGPNDVWETGTQMVRDKITSWHLDPFAQPAPTKSIYSETPPALPQVPLSELRSTSTPSRPPRPESRAATLHSIPENYGFISPVISSPSLTVDWNLNAGLAYPITPEDVHLMNAPYPESSQHCRTFTAPAPLSNRGILQDGPSEYNDRRNSSLQCRSRHGSFQSPEIAPVGVDAVPRTAGLENLSGTAHDPNLRPYILQDEDDAEILENKRINALRNLEGTGTREHDPDDRIELRAQQVLAAKRNRELGRGTPSPTGTIQRQRHGPQAPGSQSAERRYMERCDANYEEDAEPDHGTSMASRVGPSYPSNSSVRGNRVASRGSSQRSWQQYGRRASSPLYASYPSSPIGSSPTSPLPTLPTQTRSSLEQSEKFEVDFNSDFKPSELE